MPLSTSLTALYRRSPTPYGSKGRCRLGRRADDGDKDFELSVLHNLPYNFPFQVWWFSCRAPRWGRSSAASASSMASMPAAHSSGWALLPVLCGIGLVLGMRCSGLSGAEVQGGSARVGAGPRIPWLATAGVLVVLALAFFVALFDRERIEPPDDETSVPEPASAAAPEVERDATKDQTEKQKQHWDVKR